MKNKTSFIIVLLVVLLVGYLPASLLAGIAVYGVGRLIGVEPSNVVAYFALIPAYVIIGAVVLFYLRARPAKYQPADGMVTMQQLKFRIPEKLLLSKSQDGFVELISKDNRRQGVIISTTAVSRSPQQSFAAWVQEELGVQEQVPMPVKQYVASRPAAYVVVDDVHYYFVPVQLSDGAVNFMQYCFWEYEYQYIQMLKTELEVAWEWLDGLSDEVANRAVDALMSYADPQLDHKTVQ